MNKIESIQNIHRFGSIVLMGPPNAGKSTLTNSFIGQKVAIVTAKPQTTRNKVVGIVTKKDAQIVFLDTPGVHSIKNHAQGQLSKLMLQSAWESLEEADSIMLVLDGDLYIRKPESMSKDLEPFVQVLQKEKRPVFIAVNKIDLFHDKSRMLPLLEKIAEIFPAAEIFPVSALRQNGIDSLLDLVIDSLPEGKAVYPEDQYSTASMRFMVGEIIREKLFERLYQEVPYSVAVDIEVWDETTDPGRVIIHAVIYVARASHKAIVVGHAGEGIKDIGTTARKEIKRLLSKKVHLELWVKVREDWVNDDYFLQELRSGVESLSDPSF